MKKVYKLFIILLIVFYAGIIISQNKSYATTMIDGSMINKRNEKAAKLAIEKLLEPYKLNTVPEEERVIDYEQTGYGVSDFDDGERFKLSVTFNVTPYSKENTIWKEYNNLCFAEFEIINGEIEVTYVSLLPKNYDKFLERFEEYQKNAPEKIEVETVQGNKRDDIKTVQVEKISNLIFISCSIILTVAIIYIVLKISKVVRKK